MTTPPPIAEQLRQAVRDSGRTLYDVARAADVPYASLHGFMAGKSLRIESAEAIGKAIGLKVLRL
jgi:predicted transcriptional regulator